MKTILNQTGKVVILAMLFIATSAFVSKENENNDSYACYIYLYFHDKNDYNKVYVSGACHYEGYEKCGQTYNRQPKAEKAFKSYIGANYDVTIDYIYTV